MQFGSSYVFTENEFMLFFYAVSDSIVVEP